MLIRRKVEVGKHTVSNIPREVRRLSKEYEFNVCVLPFLNVNSFHLDEAPHYGDGVIRKLRVYFSLGIPTRNESELVYWPKVILVLLGEWYAEGLRKVRTTRVNLLQVAELIREVYGFILVQLDFVSVDRKS